MEPAEIYRTAQGFITAHGTKVAWQRALAKAIDQADLGRTETWLRVVAAIDELTRVQQRPGETIQ